MQMHTLNDSIYNNINNELNKAKLFASLYFFNLHCSNFEHIIIILLYKQIYKYI